MEVTETQNERSWKKGIRNWIGIPLAGGILISVVSEFESIKAGEMSEFLESAIISAIFWSVLANGNGLLIPLIDKRWTWLDQPVKRFVISLTVLLIYTILASLLIIYLYVVLYFGIEFDEVLKSRSLASLLLVPVLITLFIALWQHGREFMLSWRQEAINVERLKSENLKSKFESLQTQINPHFLFNSLNALSLLVHENATKAEEFIHKLSDVYRYVLDHQNDEVVDLSTELEFCKAFVYLNRIRFGDNFEVHYQLGDTSDWVIPPVTLQLIIENCIKHNEISMDKRLRIDIRLEEETIVVENNLNQKDSEPIESFGLGLRNITTRYELLTDKKVKIEKMEDRFRVSVPLLKIER